MKGREFGVLFMTKSFKIPQSVLVVIFTSELDVLLMRRADGDDLGAAYWQSVTGSKDQVDEDWEQTAVREVREETGIDCAGNSTVPSHFADWQLENVYGIYPQWLHRYAPGVTHNTEHIFGLQMAARVPVVLNPREHTAFQWLPYRAAAEMCFSPSNAEAVLLIPRFFRAVSTVHASVS
jgi:dATP pyrophosphohydrolase